MRLAIVALLLCVAGVAHADPTLSGTVYDRATGEPLIGATVVAGQLAEITDDLGRFVLATTGTAPVVVTVYYGEGVSTSTLTPGVPMTIPIDVGHVDDIGCVFTVPLYVTERPALGRTIRDVVAARAGTIDDLIALVPETAAQVRIEGGRRLPGAPAMSLAFLDGAVLATANDGDRVVSTAGRIDIDATAGSNQTDGQARAAIGTAGEELAGVIGGAIARDRAWYALGGDLRVAGDEVTGQGYARVDLATDDEHQGRVIALATAPGWPAADAAPAIARATSSTSRPRWADLWVDAAYRARLDDGKLDVDAGATAEALAIDGGELTRHAARAAITQRRRWLGYQSWRAEAELGAGAGPDGGRRDVHLMLGDSWMPREDLTIAVGITAERRRVGERSIGAALPHAAVVWDPTDEGTAGLFVDVSRRADLDAAAPAVWTEVTAGAEGEVHARREVLVGAAVRRRGEVDELAGWLTWPGIGLRVSGSHPIDDAGAPRARVELTRDWQVCIGALYAAAGAALDGDAASGGAVVGLRHGDLALAVDGWAGEQRIARGSIAYRW